MSEYEFWDELGNIFNAIVAYQHKTIEFNKRFVNPWLRLGTVFDQNDHNADALQAHKKAIEIDANNGSNWLSLGDVYFKMGSFDDAVTAYAKAIELNPRLGWAYANLALTHATRQKYTEAVNLYVKSLELIEDEKDRAMIWNRLGNVYRKVNDYDNAFIAFQMADECDGQNTGFQDRLDEVTVEQRVMPILAEVYVNNHAGSKSSATEAATAVDESEHPSAVEAAESPMVATVADTVANNAIFPSVEDPAGEVSEAIGTEPVAETVEAEAPVADVTAEAAAEGEAGAVPNRSEPLVAETQAESDVLEVAPTEAAVEQPPAEDIAADSGAREQAAETPAENAVAQEIQTQTPDEAPATELHSEGDQPDTHPSTPVEEREPGATQTEPVVESPAVEVAVEASPSETVLESTEAEVTADAVQSETAADPQPASATEAPSVEFTNNNASADTTVAFLMSQAVETFADPSALNQPVVLVLEDIADLIRETTPVENVAVEALAGEVASRLEVSGGAVEDPAGSNEEVANKSVSVEAGDDVAEVVAEIVALAGAAKAEETDANDNQQNPAAALEEGPVAEAAPEVAPSAEELAAGESPLIPDAGTQTEVVVNPVVDGELAEAVQESVVELIDEPAYEEFLKDAVELVVDAAGKTTMNGDEAPVKEADPKPEPDTKNAHVWNELGNVYFNTGAFEEAVTAYSRAIDLDGSFAWPYSNLALVYVQKEKYAEAILLYQRSIELFASDKEKAITWNRLGNVYRRLNDYENAIACYQRADELDPNNATRSLRSRFSLLGSLSFEQSSSLTA